MGAESAEIPQTPMRDVRTALAETLEPAAWDVLQPHARRDALIVVAAGTDLLEVGVAIAEDNTAAVQGWIERGAIRKPDATELTVWNAEPTLRFNALIVQPYVLIQELPLAE